jgi:hypothetical protein
VHLVVVLPDGSRLLIPEAWTSSVDAPLDAAEPAGPPLEVEQCLLALPDLLALRMLLDALLRMSAGQREEIDRATSPGLQCPGATSGPGDLERTDTGAEAGRSHTAGQADRGCGSSGTGRGRR